MADEVADDADDRLESFELTSLRCSVTEASVPTEALHINTLGADDKLVVNGRWILLVTWNSMEQEKHWSYRFVKWLTII